MRLIHVGNKMNSQSVMLSMHDKAKEPDAKFTITYFRGVSSGVLFAEEKEVILSSG